LNKTPLFNFVIDAADVHEEQSVIQDEDIGGKNALAGALEKAGCPGLGESDWWPQSLGEQSPRSDRHGPRPWDRARSRNREAAVGRLFGPFVDAVKLPGFGRGEEAVGLLAGFVETAGAEIILPALEHGVGEFNRKNLGQHGQILFDQLLLEIDGVGGDDGLAFVVDREKDGRDQIGQALANTGAGLDDEVLLVARALATATAIAAGRRGTRSCGIWTGVLRRKNLLDPLDEICLRSRGFCFNQADHFPSPAGPAIGEILPWPGRRRHELSSVQARERGGRYPGRGFSRSFVGRIPPPPLARLNRRKFVAPSPRQGRISPIAGPAGEGK